MRRHGWCGVAALATALVVAACGPPNATDGDQLPNEAATVAVSDVEMSSSAPSTTPALLQFFSPANNPGHGKLYVQEIDALGNVIKEFKNTLGPEGLIETKWVHGGPQG